MLVAFLFPVALAAQAPRAAGLGLRGPGPAAPQAGRPAPTAATILRQLAATHQFTEVALSPDGARAAWVEELYAAGPALGNDTGTSRIHVQGLAAPITAASSTRAAAEGGIVWSPDGSRLAFLSDAAHAGQMQLYTAPAVGGPARQLTHLTGFLTDARWSPDGSSLAFLFAENAPSGGGPLHPEPPATGVIGGAIHNQRLAVVPAAGGAARQITPANLNVYEFDWSPDGRRFAFTAAPGPGDNNWWLAQLYTAALGDGTPHLVFKVTDPQGQIAMPRWSPDGATLAFIHAVPAIDPNRLGITGWSYGGYMTMWAITQTHRFRAAVAGAGLSDWLSYYGENSIDQWMTPYFGDTIYNDRAVYARSGPINFIKNVQTPTLLVVGERDGECPAPQSFEYWHALETLGVPTRLVVYPGEGHMFAQTAHIRDVLERTAAWFDQYLR